MLVSKWNHVWSWLRRMRLFVFVSFPWTWCSGYRIMTITVWWRNRCLPTIHLHLGETWFCSNNFGMCLRQLWHTFQHHFQNPFGSVTLRKQTINFDFSSGFWENLKWIIVGVELASPQNVKRVEDYFGKYRRKETPLK